MPKTAAGDKTLVGHLDELRKRLIIIGAANIVAIVVSFQFAETAVGYFVQLNPGMQLVYISPAEQFTVNMTLSVICGILLALPITVGQIWAFVVTGMTAEERRVGVTALYIGLVFFAAGVAFCYMVILPFTLRYFYGMTVEGIPAMISIREYVSFINSMLLCFGLIFEMPVLVFALTWLGMVKPAWLEKSRGVLIVIIFVAAAIITPPDVISQVMLGIPMWALLEFSIFISKLVFAAKSKKSAAAEAAAS